MSKLYNFSVQSSPSNLCTKLLEYYKDTKFVSDPASMKYHHVYVGGLLAHSYEVFDELKKLVKLNNLDYSDETLFLIAYGHDLDKINSYWYNEDGTYGFRPLKKFGRTHGENSFYKLEEALGEEFKSHKDYDIIRICIVGHMGECDRTHRAKDFYNENVEKYPLLWLTHQADLRSCLLNGSTVSDYLEDVDLIKVEVQYKISEDSEIFTVIVLGESEEQVASRFEELNPDWIPINYRRI